MNHTALTVTFFSFLRPDGKIQLMSGSSSEIEDAMSTEIVDLNAKTSVPGYDLNYDHGDVSLTLKLNLRVIFFKNSKELILI